MEFCKKCGSLMLPSKQDNQYLMCTLCDYKMPISDDIKNSYLNKKEIHHPIGEAFKNENKMKNWAD